LSSHSFVDNSYLKVGGITLLLKLLNKLSFINSHERNLLSTKPRNVHRSYRYLTLKKNPDVSDIFICYPVCHHFLLHFHFSFFFLLEDDDDRRMIHLAYMRFLSIVSLCLSTRLRQIAYTRSEYMYSFIVILKLLFLRFRSFFIPHSFFSVWSILDFFSPNLPRYANFHSLGKNRKT